MHRIALKAQWKSITAHELVLQARSVLVASTRCGDDPRFADDETVQICCSAPVASLRMSLRRTDSAFLVPAVVNQYLGSGLARPAQWRGQIPEAPSPKAVFPESVHDLLLETCVWPYD